MLSKGIIMLLIGGAGLVLTITWILVDLVNKSKHEEKMIKKAVENFARIPIKRNDGTANPINNEEVNISPNFKIDSKMNSQENDALVDNITEMELTEMLVEESTEILIEIDELDKEEETTEILINKEVTEYMDEEKAEQSD